MSVVPPPMSTSATPSSFSSSVSTDSLAASCSTTVSATSTPARFTHATMFCVELWLPVTMWTFTSSRAPVIPTGAPMPSCSSTTKSCGSTCRISRPVGSDTALAASIARRTSSRVISRFLPATAITPRLLKPLMCGPGQRQVHRVDLDAGHQLGLLDRLLDRVDRRLEVDDDAAPDAARLGDADADDVEPVAVEHLADDRRHLRRADVEPDQIPLFSRHAASEVRWSCRVVPSPPLARARLPRRPHVDRARRTAGPRSRCPAPRSRSAGARSRYDCSRCQELVVAEVRPPPGRRPGSPTRCADR